MIGMDFRTAPVGVRERVSFSSAGAVKMLHRLRDAFPDIEFVLISTCNRTELYAASPNVEERQKEILGVLLSVVGTSREELGEHFYCKARLEAVQHLFAVVSGLDSMVVGENEILGQVKQAYALSIDAETSGERLHPLFQHAFRAAKRVRTETAISRGRVSVSSIAVEFVEKIFDDLDRKTVMIVGAGETAELVLKTLLEKGVGRVLVANRSEPKCQSLAERYGGEAVSFDELDDELHQADIVMSSTSAPHSIIHASAVRRAMRRRQGQPMLLMDIAVPRDIDPGVAGLENVYLYDIDDLQKIAAENLAKRQTELSAARQIVREEACEMASTFGAVDLGALMRLLEERASAASDAELDGLKSRPVFESLSGAQREEIANLTRRAVNRILGEPRKALRRASRNGSWDEFSRVTRDMFGLESGKDLDEESL